MTHPYLSLKRTTLKYIAFDSFRKYYTQIRVTIFGIAVWVGVGTSIVHFLMNPPTFINTRLLCLSLFTQTPSFIIVSFTR